MYECPHEHHSLLPTLPPSLARPGRRRLTSMGPSSSSRVERQKALSMGTRQSCTVFDAIWRGWMEGGREGGMEGGRKGGNMCVGASCRVGNNSRHFLPSFLLPSFTPSFPASVLPTFRTPTTMSTSSWESMASVPAACPRPLLTLLLLLPAASVRARGQRGGEWMRTDSSCCS